MANYDTQARIPSSQIFEVGAPLDVGRIVDISLGVNNFKQHAGCHPLIAQAFVPDLFSYASTVECVVCPPFAPRPLEDGYTKLAFFMRTWRTSGEGNVIWRLYCSRKLYRGPLAFSAGFLEDYVFAPLLTESDTPTISFGEFTIEDFIGDVDSNMWLLLTAQGGAGSPVAHCSQLSVFPRVE